MAIVFGHVWALWWWRSTHVKATADSLRTKVCWLEKAPSTAAELKEAKASETRVSYLDCGIPRDLPLELISKDAVPRTRLVGVKVHQWNGVVPLGSICRAGEVLTSSPEFCFVQIANDVRRICLEKLPRWQYIVVLVELGCELCGTYSKQESKRGFKNRDVPLVSSYQLFMFVGRVAHERGAGLAYEALRWVVDGLNSPMETVLYLMLCLPRAWGGLALTRPLSNWPIQVPEEFWSKTTYRHIVPDLCWPEYMLIVEYFGGDSHEGREVPDAERQELAQDMGYKIITFRKGDLRDLRRFNAKARMVARYLGKELPKADEDFQKLQAVLQQMLVKHKSWV